VLSSARYVPFPTLMRIVTSPKKKVAAKPKKPAAHPKYSEMVDKAISALKERGGSSRQAILKYISRRHLQKYLQILSRSHDA
jgi:hypothetical protein